jgi:DNA (cytosine-5)-methyltransferase 1
MHKKALTVIDFFSGAGGFSEGFRQQGFTMVKGIDFWEPAVKTHNLNHGLDDIPENVLDYVGENSADVTRIESLPDVDVIIGSPSCVTFSMSNKGGKADKTEGLRLIEAYLRVIAVKKHKKHSILKTWLMENVPNSGNYVKHDYTFADLNLRDWANQNDIDADSIALTLNGVVLNASDYGAPQNRNRFICGEHVASHEFPLPTKASGDKVTLADIKSKMPSPNMTTPTGNWQDPNYPSLTLAAEEISDHFYDTGIPILDWDQAKNLKTMHPFMGKMSFPEKETVTSRTVTATRSTTTREAIIYKSEYNRQGNGEYRTPTIREVASLMGYPYTYQFFGSEGMIWKQIGNSVSPKLSSALARAILEKEGLKTVPLDKVSFTRERHLYKSAENLNTFSEKKFDKPKIRRPGARFRRSVHKSRNMTVDLLNYEPGRDVVAGDKWIVRTYYGTGPAHRTDLFDIGTYKRIQRALTDNFSSFNQFLGELNSGMFDEAVPADVMQGVYERDSDLIDARNPIVILNNLKRLVTRYVEVAPEQNIKIGGLVREEYSLTQMLYMFSLAHMVYNNWQSQAINEPSTLVTLKKQNKLQGVAAYGI